MKCSVPGCERFSVVRVMAIQSRRCVLEQDLCKLHSQQYIDRDASTTLALEGVPGTIEGATCFDVQLILLRRDAEHHEVYLREAGGERQFILLFDSFEASALSCWVRGPPPPRPSTHHLMVNTVRALGASLEHVLIHNDMAQRDACVADLSLVDGDRVVRVEARPSDAVCLAILADAPIYVADTLIPGTSSAASDVQGTSPWTKPDRAPNTGEELDGVFFLGQYAYRRPGSLKWILMSLVLAALICVVAGRQLMIAVSVDDSVLGAGLIVLLLVTAMFAAYRVFCLWGWVTNHVDPVEISERGIRYGRRHWAWESVARVQIIALPSAWGCWGLHLRLRRCRRKEIVPMFIDGRRTAEEHTRLLSQIQRFCKDSGFDVVCDRSITPKGKRWKAKR